MVIASINEHKSNTTSSSSYSVPPARGRGGYRGGRGYNSYYGSGSTYRMNNKYVRPGHEVSSSTITQPAPENSNSIATGSSSSTVTTTAASTSSTPSGKAIQGIMDSMTDIGLGSNAATRPSSSKAANLEGTRDVLIGGVAFESSARSLVRKDRTLSLPYSYRIWIVIAMKLPNPNPRRRSHH